ncbi:LacI family DNA-binding transcriptional regulator [Breznakiella homolactica]|uniref:LacI family DNA-binding transcriptional regulator n=1 Tax=Breznakiella homolactica TaxID=2798577 RepID=A0A7T7XPG1_9SPIR|nr:LacI family DNA-binding transcriptional regulator [Breznakiella homolactica]QQO10080.1 LacI family transcriptional regulator [Breznakiella homolactica]
MGSVNITEVARQAGVSKATVSNFLNKKSDKLSDETRARIEKVISDLNYIPSFGARRMLNNRTQTIGIILENMSIQSMFSIAFYGLVHAGISESFQDHNYRSLIIPISESFSREGVDYLKELSRGMVDGFLLFNIRENDQYIKAFAEFKIPFMCFGHVQAQNVPNYVGTDYRNGVIKAVEHLFSHNLNNIAVSAGIEESIVGSQIKEGFIEAHKKHGRSCNPANVITGKRDHDESVYDECLALLSSGEKPDAFILSESHYHDLERAAKKLGLKIPEDIKCILFAYYPRTASGKFTYLKAPLHDIGKSGAENLIKLINGEKIKPCLFPLELVMGRSCGCS